MPRAECACYAKEGGKEEERNARPQADQSLSVESDRRSKKDHPQIAGQREGGQDGNDPQDWSSGLRELPPGSWHLERKITVGHAGVGLGRHTCKICRVAEKPLLEIGRVGMIAVK